MRWPHGPEDAGVFLAGICYGVGLFWGVTFLVTYLVLGVGR